MMKITLLNTEMQVKNLFEPSSTQKQLTQLKIPGPEGLENEAIKFHNGLEKQAIKFHNGLEKQAINFHNWDRVGYFKSPQGCITSFFMSDCILYTDSYVIDNSCLLPFYRTDSFPVMELYCLFLKAVMELHCLVFKALGAWDFN